MDAMKRMLILLLSAGLAATAPAPAPAPAQERQDIAIDRAMIQSDRQAIVAENLPLTDRQAQAFWPMYREYRAELAKLGDRLVELVLAYARSAEALSDSQATAMLDEFLSIQKDQIKIQSAWVPKFRRVLPTKTVTRFFQIENKLDSILRYDAVEEIPLVRIDRS